MTDKTSIPDATRIYQWMGKHDVVLPNAAFKELREMLAVSSSGASQPVAVKEALHIARAALVSGDGEVARMAILAIDKALSTAPAAPTEQWDDNPDGVKSGQSHIRMNSDTGFWE